MMVPPAPTHFAPEGTSPSRSRSITFFMRSIVSFMLLFAFLPHAQAQDEAPPLRITLAEAVEIALIHNYVLQQARMAEEDARLQIQLGVADIGYPTIEAFSSYTRNIREANPFAGSSAGDFFSGFAFVEWLGFNETARTDELEATQPITFGEFADRQRRGLDAAGIAPAQPSDNPFSVANQYLNSITLTQTILDAPRYTRLLHPDGFAAARQQIPKAVERQEQIIIGQVREAFYGALLAQEESRVAAQSVARTRTSRNETALRVSNGVLPKMERLTMDVELANRESELIQAQTRASNSIDQLKYLIGMTPGQELVLNGTLTIHQTSPYLAASASTAFEEASTQRPDLEEARLAHRYALNEVRATKMNALPKINGFVNFNYTGRVPDNRSYTISDPYNPFAFTQGNNTYFSKAYWQSALNVGLSLEWTLFNGFERRRNVQRAEVAARQAGVNVDQLTANAKMEIETALRNLDTAYHQIGSQEVNVTNAELNYEYTLARSREGVANSLQVRAASSQLDTSRLNYLRAVHSYLVAQSNLEVALGIPIEKQTDLQLASANR